MTEEGAAPTPPGSGGSRNGRWRVFASRARTALAHFVRLFTDDGDSPLADLRTALGDVRPVRVVWGLCGLVLFGYLSTGVYSVAPGEAAVVRRFGSVIEPRVDPGIHYRMPWPVGRVDIVNVSQVRRETVGILEPEEDHVHPEPPSKLRALSGDTNVVAIEVIVQYQVRDPADYLFNVKYAPYRIVRDVLRAAVTSLVTTLPVDALLTTGRQSLQQGIREETQKHLDRYGSGLVVVGVDLQKAFPPIDVAAAFTDVNTARENKLRTINEGQGYANSLIPEARGEAQRIRAEGQAYRSEVLAQAVGSAQAFQAMLTEYRKNSAAYGEDVTRYRMYLETIDKIMPRVQIYALDKTNGGVVNLRLFGNGAGGPIAVGEQTR